MKLLDTYNTVTLSKTADGTLIPCGIQGFSIDREDIEFALAEVKRQLTEMDDKVRLPAIEQSELYAEIEANGTAMSDSECQRYGDRILSGSKPLVPRSNEHRELAALHRKSQAIVTQHNRTLAVASELAKRQQAFLTSQDFFELRRLTFTELATAFEEISETTVRRLVHRLRLEIDGWVVKADKLINNSVRPPLCRVIMEVLEIHPKAGAPKIHKILKSRGIIVSQRSVGNALALLRKYLLKVKK
ncbi:MAG: hypothetical protein AB2809_20995 [Candidatus Thiodiazotropha sp.]